MDRKQLRELFSNLNSGDKLKVNFNSGSCDNYTVKARRVWKGKGGSILLECTNDVTGTEAKIGTFSADSIVNVSINGAEQVGLATGTVLPTIYKTDKNKSIALKAQFLELLGRKNVEISVESATEPGIAGSFRVEAVRKTPGRCGPVVLDLVNLSTGEKTVLSAVRHSSIIDRITVSTVNEVTDSETVTEDEV